MKTLKSPPESFEELVFKNRNREYGAYLLRKSYSQTVFFATVIALFVFSIPVSMLTRLKGTQKIEIKNPIDDVTVYIKKTVIELPPLPDPPKSALKPLNPVKESLLAPVVVETGILTGMTTQGELNQATAATAPSGNPDPAPPQDPVKATISPAADPERIEKVPQEQPEFPGGDAARYKFLKDNLRYPAEAKELGISGTVYLTFVVERDGSITSISILRGIGGGCEEEAIRVVKMMPRWTPGRQNGTPVRVQFNLPVKFVLY